MNIYKKILQIISETDINQWECVKYCYRDVYEKNPECNEFSKFKFVRDDVKIVFSFSPDGDCTIDFNFDGEIISKEFKSSFSFFNFSKNMLLIKLQKIVWHIMTQYKKEEQDDEEKEMDILNRIFQKLKA